MADSPDRSRYAYGPSALGARAKNEEPRGVYETTREPQRAEKLALGR